MSAKSEDLPVVQVEMKQDKEPQADSTSSVPSSESVIPIPNAEPEGNEVLEQPVTESQVTNPDAITTPTTNEGLVDPPPREEKGKPTDVENTPEVKEKSLERLRLTNKSLQYALQVLQDIEPPSKVVDW
jgi:hypothetical protein